MTYVTYQLAETLGALERLDAALGCDVSIVEDELRELRRLDKAAPHRRGGPGSRDARKYELGSVLVMSGIGDVDAHVLLGLLAHPLLMMRWLGEAIVKRPRANLADLLNTVFADPEKRAFCKQWGCVLSWRYRKPQYDAAVTSFLESGKAGPDEPWRTKYVTPDQSALVDTLCTLLDQPMPDFVNRGEAFDWIYEHGGNPNYWNEPEIPEEWRG